MNLRFTLTFMTLPTLMGSVLTVGIVAERASAIGVSPATPLTSSQASCDVPLDRDLNSSSIWHQNQSFVVASAGTTAGELDLLDFSEAESDAAVTLFGCDCPACIGALRQLQSQSLLDNGSGHCWTSMQRRVSPQTMREVLENLENTEAGQAR